MGSYNAQYEDYYKSISKDNYGGSSIYYPEYKGIEKKDNKSRVTKRLIQELIGVFIMIAFVLFCKIVVTPKTQQAYSYAKDIVDKSYDYNSMIKKVQGLNFEKVKNFTVNYFEGLKSKIIDNKTIKDKIKKDLKNSIVNSKYNCFYKVRRNVCLS